jgi:hypothetical protein
MGQSLVGKPEVLPMIGSSGFDGAFGWKTVVLHSIPVNIA